MGSSVSRIRPSKSNIRALINWLAKCSHEYWSKGLGSRGKLHSSGLEYITVHAHGRPTSLPRLVRRRDLRIRPDRGRIDADRRLRLPRREPPLAPRLFTPDPAAAAG